MWVSYHSRPWRSLDRSVVHNGHIESELPIGSSQKQYRSTAMTKRNRRGGGGNGEERRSSGGGQAR